MKKILVIYNNPWIFAQTLSVLDEIWDNDYDILINEKYHNTKNQISHSKTWLLEYVHKESIRLEDTKNYDIIIRPTPAKDDWLDIIYKKFPTANYIYIEEWMWFYVSDLQDLSWDTYFNNWEVYLTAPEKLKWAKKINNKKVLSIVKWRYKKELKDLPKEIKTIIFTEPITFDEHDKSYKDKISKLIEDYQKPLLLKKHFRDDTKYQYGEWVYECLNQIPWQLFFELYPHAKIIFTWITTLELYIHDKSRIIKF